MTVINYFDHRKTILGAFAFPVQLGKHNKIGYSTYKLVPFVRSSLFARVHAKYNPSHRNCLLSDTDERFRSTDQR